MDKSTTRARMERLISLRTLDQITLELIELESRPWDEVVAMVHCMYIESLEARFPEVAEAAWEIALEAEEPSMAFGEALLLAMIK